LKHQKKCLSEYVGSELSLKRGKTRLRADVLDVSKALKQAVDTAQLTLWDFLYELGKRKVSCTNITVDDLREELGKI